MTWFFETLGSYFAYPFVRYATVAVILIALCASLLGVPLVLKRFSFIGDGLSHVAFGAMAVAAVLNTAEKTFFPELFEKIGQTPLVLLLTMAAAILLLRTGQNTKIKGDAVVAMISVGALAFGYLLLHLFPTSSNITGDVCSTLFGSTSILTLTRADVVFSAVMALLVAIVFLFFYRKIFSVTFDEDFSRATGTRAGAYNLLIAVVTAVVIVMAMNLVGSLLISALVVFPALSAMRIFKSFRAVTICAAVLSVAAAAVGILISLLAVTPTGATIVAVDGIVFLLFSLAGLIRGGTRA
ncbi:MAG: metal ABC transporter permease [Clostridia bacterium]|nr:metal ABC transporter permease [Clostridia bacterium]